MSMKVFHFFLLVCCILVACIFMTEGKFSKRMKACLKRDAGCCKCVAFCVPLNKDRLHLGKRNLSKLISFSLDLHYLC